MWPGKIAPGIVSHATVSTLDYFPTLASLAGVTLPSDRVYDGVDISPVLFQNSSIVRDYLFHPDQFGNITGMRYRSYKAYFTTWGTEPCEGKASSVVNHNPPLVFDLDADVSEKAPLAPAAIPSFVMQKILEGHKSKLNSIATTFRSVTNYSTSPDAQPCCNPHNVVCRCT